MRPTDGSVEDFLAAIASPTRRTDGQALCRMMQEITGTPPVLWGSSIVGFGQYHYRYDSGREGDAFRVGFSPRKANLVIYIMPGFGEYQELLDRLGPHRTGSSCLYVTRLARIDVDVLRELVSRSWDHMAAKYAE